MFLFFLIHACFHALFKNFYTERMFQKQKEGSTICRLSTYNADLLLSHIPSKHTLWNPVKGTGQNTYAKIKLHRSETEIHAWFLLVF